MAEREEGGREGEETATADHLDSVEWFEDKYRGA